MFGYVRPLKSELKVGEYERFKSIYCGLCRTLREHCGLLTNASLSYDFVFLAMLLESGDGQETEELRCISHPFVKRSVCCTDEVLKATADMSVILSRLKLKDNVNDRAFLESVPSRLGACAFLLPYNKARSRLPEYAQNAEKLLEELAVLENEGCQSLDETSDKFARITALAAEYADGEEKRRILNELLYHIGRWIYIIDAYDDLSEDAEEHSYNALAARFGTDTLSDEDRDTVRITLDNSLGLAAAAYELLPRGIWSEILDNIIYYGLSSVQRMVLEGDSRNKSEKEI